MNQPGKEKYITNTKTKNNDNVTTVAVEPLGVQEMAMQSRPESWRKLFGSGAASISSPPQDVTLLLSR